MKERNGFVCLPTRVTASKESDHTALAALKKRNIKLEEDLENSRVKYNCVVDNLEEANRKNRTLEELNNKQRKSENDEQTIAGLVEEMSSLKSKNIDLRDKLAEQNWNIEDHKKSILVKNKVADKLNKELHETKKRAENLVKAHKSEVKAWRKDLGEETKRRIKLMTKLIILVRWHQNLLLLQVQSQVIKQKNSFEIIYSICGTEIVDYKPQYFLRAAFNPACADCEDSLKGDNSDPDLYGCKQFQQQCMLEQPLPPPTPSNPLETDINILDGDKPLFISSMVSHCNLNFIKLYQRLVYEQKFGNLILAYELKL